MSAAQFVTIPQLAELLGVSRIAVYKQVKAGKITAKKVGRIYLIPKAYVQEICGGALTQARKGQIALAVKRTVREYGEALKMLGSE
jgi:excisionase family DNA binding protein